MTAQAAPHYLSTAFYSQYNLILLSGSALFSLASASTVPLAIGCAAELCWLSLGPRLGAFRRRVDARSEAERRAKLEDEVLMVMRSLGPEHTARALAVNHGLSLISLHVDASTTDPAERAAWAELEHVRPAFVRCCRLEERLGHRLEELQLAPPEQEMARLSQAYAAEKDLGMRLTLHQAIKLEQRKLEQLARMIEQRRQIRMKLTLVEQSLTHLRGQQQLGVPLPELLADAHALMNLLAGAAALEAELGEAAPMSVGAPSSR